MGVDGQCHALAALPPGKTRYPVYRRLGGSQGQSGLVRKISHPLALIPGPSSPLLYRLSYPGPQWPSLVTTNMKLNFYNHLLLSLGLVGSR